ncbi:hypothetical protein JCM11641_001427 [Rhodosporidiobolus odoratus]
MSSFSSPAPPRLRTLPPSFPSLTNPSDVLVPTDVPGRASPRALFLSRASISTTPPPVVSRSAWIPDALVAHLMANKRDSAIASKYRKGTSITNMEAALHSFVTALAKVTQCADYAWQGGHSAAPLGTTSSGRDRLGRRVVLSTSLHCDFERDEVAELFFAVEEQTVLGVDVLAAGTLRVPGVQEKNDDAFRLAYDCALKRHAVFHLLPLHSLPSIYALPHRPWSIEEAVSTLSRYLATPFSAQTPTPTAFLQDRSVRLTVQPHRVLSLSMLLATHVHLLANELSALESLVDPVTLTSRVGRLKGGYAYTFDPPSIFSRRFSTVLSTLLTICALRELVLSSPSPSPAFPKMRLFALTTFTPELASLLPRLRLTLPPHIRIISRSDLFPPPSLTLATADQIPELEGTMLVIHNNSDAFGQNIETEERGGSVDGEVGWWGDGARALRRDRVDLLRWVG